MNIRKAHCLFEQSGTFKNEFIKLGIPAEDYDILNNFGQTDHVCDLYKEIEGGYEGKPSIFDAMTEDDIIMNFFPCTRFEAQILLKFRGDLYQQLGQTDVEKLEADLKLHKELSVNYELITKLSLICLKRNLKMVFENPYSEQHYLTRYWCIKPKLIDKDRSMRGDYYIKPTQYWFFNREPSNNLIFEPMNINFKGTITKAQVEAGSREEARSMIHPDYANRFIREFIL